MGLYTNTIFPAGGDTGNGGIIQIVQTAKTDTFVMSSNGDTWTDVTGLSVDITPTDSSNNILVIASFNMAADQAHRHGFRLLRGSSLIFVGDTNSDNQRAAGFQGNPPTNANNYHYTPVYLDSPSTTSAVTYKVQVRGEQNSTDVFINRPQSDNTGGDYFRGASSITVMEVSS